jgi:hypothetical protein
MIMYGGGPNHGPGPSSNVALTYDPKTDSWTTEASPDIGGRSFVFNQGVTTKAGAATFFTGHPNKYPSVMAGPGDGATFDFATKSWSTIKTPPDTVLENPQREGEALFWLGDKFYAYGGYAYQANPTGGLSRVATATGAVYDPSTTTWAAMPSGGPAVTSTDNSFGARMNGEAMVWADTMMIYRP